jgi:uncharacterized protein (DUF952 family)
MLPAKAFRVPVDRTREIAGSTKDEDPTRAISDRDAQPVRLAGASAQPSSGNIAIFTGRWRMTTIYKICEEKMWRDAERDGAFFGSAVDYADGFIHFSSAAQVAGTAGRHFTGMSGLVLVAVDGEALGPALKWEPSRGGALFPHLYGPLQLTAVRWVKPLRLDPDGRHVFPKLEE